jgi:hypothetical protein
LISDRFSGRSRRDGGAADERECPSRDDLRAFVNGWPVERPVRCVAAAAISLQPAEEASVLTYHDQSQAGD